MGYLIIRFRCTLYRERTHVERAMNVERILATVQGAVTQN